MWSSREATNKIIGYYSYLFSYPSLTTMLIIILILPSITCIVAFNTAFGYEYSINGLTFGSLGISLPILLILLASLLVVNGDDFLNKRRLTILSYSSCILLSFFILIFSIAARLTGFSGLLESGFIFAVSLWSSLRYLVISVFSRRSIFSTLFLIHSEPLLIIASSNFLLPFSNLVLIAKGLLALIVSSLGAVAIIQSLEQWNDSQMEVKLLNLFRGFILAWAENKSELLEKQITLMGEERDLAVDLLIFNDERGSAKAGLIVPYIHPGPFRNVGSSSMPHTLSKRLKDKLGCVVLVPHGVSTHELDLTNSKDLEKIIQAVSSNLGSGLQVETASDIVWVRKNKAQASCQVFRDLALITLTLSPKSYDDLPEELGEQIKNAVEAMNMRVVVIDSHNSIDLNDEITSRDIEDLYEAAIEAIMKAKDLPQSKFSVGVHRIIPAEWNLKDGMGPEGISALTIKAEKGRTFTYVILDGNNMIRGLREDMIKELKSKFPVDLEILTSDTHLVNAIGVTTRGYYPLGEKTDGEKITEYVTQVIEASLSSLIESKITFHRTIIPGLTVLGRRGLHLISEVLKSAFNLFIKASIISLGISMGIVAIIVFVL
ncbi:DUF2070 family protein [Candidatus Bathyarchaeota archaeon]|nr:DUF2070 family protein [Candidatus Bathyarchaeota archaeon]